MLIVLKKTITLFKAWQKILKGIARTILMHEYFFYFHIYNAHTYIMIKTTLNYSAENANYLPTCKKFPNASLMDKLKKNISWRYTISDALLRHVSIGVSWRVS